MSDKNRFQEMLKDILEVAKVQGNILSIEEVKSLFGDLQLTEEQYEQIFAYLAANNIKVNGFMEKDYLSSISQYKEDIKTEELENEKAESGEDELDDTGEEENKSELKSKIESNKSKDSAYLEMYLEDISAIKPISSEEEQEIFHKIINGDSIAKNRLIEGYLSYVVEIARNYINKGTLLEDLIQEGNIGLMSSLENLSNIEIANIKEFITDSIKNFMEAAIDMEEDSNSFENRIINKTKIISDAAKEIAEDQERDATIQELVDKTKIPVDEIKDLLSMSVDAVKVKVHHHSPKLKVVDKKERK